MLAIFPIYRKMFLYCIFGPEQRIKVMHVLFCISQNVNRSIAMIGSV